MKPSRVGAGEEAGDPKTGVTAFAPATVGNVICGFDVLGLALDEPGDRVTARLSANPGVRIREVIGDDGRIPTEADRNSAGAAAAALIEASSPGSGVDLVVTKGLPLAAGMGGSAASAVAAAVAVDALLGTDSSSAELLEFALEGERVAAGQAHGDNAAPALLGGLVLVRQSDRRPIVQLPVPEGLSVALLRPHVEMPTRAARAAVGDRVDLRDAVAQLGHIAAFVSGLHTEDWNLISDSLVDRIAEPHRSAGIPAFRKVREAALAKGALGCGISGAGPSVFALCRSFNDAHSVGKAMSAEFAVQASISADLFVSPVSRTGARVVPASEDPEKGE